MAKLLSKLRAHWKVALGLAVAGMFAAFFLVVGGAYGLAVTSTEEFCIGRYAR